MDTPKLHQKALDATRLRCRTLVCVMGVGKLYVVSNSGRLTQAHFPRPSDLSEPSSMLMSTSVGAAKWVYVRVFPSTAACVAHLERHGFASVVTSPRTARARAE